MIRHKNSISYISLIALSLLNINRVITLLNVIYVYIYYVMLQELLVYTDFTSPPPNYATVIFPKI